MEKYKLTNEGYRKLLNFLKIQDLKSEIQNLN